ncbi:MULTISPECIES: phosphotransferase enzyme family protein [Methylobacterium]|uniref:Homoserine kinase n=1 Tax=Methylobacterium thuringiense TaxID=1003091 RepID=A0ABQ4TLE2_9HYPH|nr:MULTISPECIES: phosphotransferase [Methylobacterium]TXN23485.1 phosphotransferase [Methylobacterium sp. WL9]GJE56185.1 Homoserine kinase [Methylobacterium thuringiense]
MSDIDLNDLSRCYGRAFLSCDLVAPGANRTYRLATKGEAYYLRLYRAAGRSPAEIAFELRLLREVRPTPGIDVARPIRTAEGADCASIVFESVTRAACLFQALGGRAVACEIGDMALFGAALAKLHDALAGIEGGEVRLLDLDPQTVCMRATASLAAIPHSAAARHAIDHCRMEMLRGPAPHDLPSGNCHGDAWSANAIIRDGSVGFIDFDDCGYGPYLLDLGTPVWHLVMREPSQSGALVAALLAGYESERALTKAERLALPNFVKLAEVRSLTFLAEFCTLEDGLWSRVLDRAVNLLERELII